MKAIVACLGVLGLGSGCALLDGLAGAFVTAAEVVQTPEGAAAASSAGPAGVAVAAGVTVLGVLAEWYRRARKAKRAKAVTA